jgi:hypothetical protein
MSDTTIAILSLMYVGFYMGFNFGKFHERYTTNKEGWPE